MITPGSANPLLFHAVDGSYQISRSLRFRSSASAYLSRTPASAGSRTSLTLSAWVKRGALGAVQYIFSASEITGNLLRFNADDTLTFYTAISATTYGLQGTTAVFRDTSAWYHIVAVIDTNNGTPADRMRLYVNNTRISTATTNNVSSITSGATTDFNQAQATYFSRYFSGGAQYFDGYLAEVNFIDGSALTPSSFGAFDTNGVWQPAKYTGSYTGNSFYLPFTNSSAIGTDSSGLGNNWTPSASINTTSSGVTYDWMLDSPTNYADGGNGRGNYCVLSPLDFTGSGTVSDGNLKYVSGGSGVFRGTMGMTASSGKWYWEVTQGTTVNPSNPIIYGMTSLQGAPSHSAPQRAALFYCDGSTGHSVNIYNNAAYVTSVNINITSVAVNDVIQFAYDSATGKFWVGKNNSWCDGSGGSTGDPASGANPTYTMPSVDQPMTPSFDHAGVGYTVYLNCGQRGWDKTCPSGYSALNTQNLPTPTIAAGNKYFDVALFPGNGTSQNITSYNFSPDLIWGKGRSVAYSNGFADVIRGNSNLIFSDSTSAEVNPGAQLDLIANGFTATYRSANWAFNQSAATYVAWGWKAGGTGVSNTSGSITSTVSANVSAGFSIVTYAGTGVNATVGHGLGAIPSMMFVKDRDSSTNGGAVYHTSLGATKYLKLFQTAAATPPPSGTDAEAIDNTIWNGGSPTFNSSVFSIGTNARTNSTDRYVAYCFAPVAGYSAFGSYTGNGSADGPFVYCGFRPRWVLYKCSSTAATGWTIFDTSRDLYNIEGQYLQPNTSAAEGTSGTLDILSNGFKPRVTSTDTNASGGTYIYAAFAENPFKTARAR